MKKIVSISFGSSSRDKKVELDVHGEQFIIERKGTDGSKEKAKELYEEYDGNADAIGIGGTDLYFCIEDKFYKLRDTEKLIEDVKESAVVDGIGIKLTREVQMPYLVERYFNVAGKKVFIPCAVDRYPLAKEFSKIADCTFGDLMTTLRIPVPLKNIKHVKILASALLPVITKMPIEYFYPLGEKQDENTPKFEKYFKDNEIIASDFHFIRRYAPSDLEGKVIITNTTTEKDVEFLKERGVKLLATSTPVISGRSFGTNVLEAIVCSILKRKRGEEGPESGFWEYNQILRYKELQPSIRFL